MAMERRSWEGPIKVVLEVDMHCGCLGCAEKVERAVRAVSAVDGVHEVMDDSKNNKLTVTVVGKVDPKKIQKRIKCKTKKTVVLVSTRPDKKVHFTEPVVSTVILKIKLCCDACNDKMKRIISKSKLGVEHVTVDPQKDLVTVKGTMDAKTLTEYLKEKLKRDVEIVQPKKDDGGGDKKGKGGGGGGEKKDKEGGGGGGGEKKDGDKKGGGEEKKEEAGKAEGNKYEYIGGYTPYSGYEYSVESVHAPQIFSDENPNACSIM